MNIYVKKQVLNVEFLWLKEKLKLKIFFVVRLLMVPHKVRLISFGIGFAMRSRFIFAGIIIASQLAKALFQPSLVMVMMCRDEEVNLKSNLKLWLAVVDYFIILIDSRTKDNSIEVAKSILDPSRRNKYKIVTYTFEGFGQARTQVHHMRINNIYAKCIHSFLYRV